MTPAKVYSRTSPSINDIMTLLEECQAKGVSEDCYNHLTRIATFEPDLRLAVNLKTFLGLMVFHEVTNILHDGLSSEERNLLIELDLRGLTTLSRETAHGLLNVHERWTLLKRMSEIFRKAKESKDEHLPEGVL